MDYFSEQVYNAARMDYELAGELLEKKSEWRRYLATSATALLGILVSLTDMRSDTFCVRILFAVVVVLLVLGILLLSLSLLSDIYYLDKGRSLFSEETRKAYREQRPQEPVSVQRNKVLEYSASAGAICCALALLSLCVLSLLRIF